MQINRILSQIPSNLLTTQCSAYTQLISLLKFAWKNLPISGSRSTQNIHLDIWLGFSFNTFLLCTHLLSWLVQHQSELVHICWLFWRSKTWNTFYVQSTSKPKLNRSNQKFRNSSLNLLDCIRSWNSSVNSITMVKLANFNNISFVENNISD